MWMLSWRSRGSSSMPRRYRSRGRDYLGAMSSAVERLAAQLSELAGAAVELERPNDPDHGDFATNVALRTAKAADRPPRELATELAERFAGLDGIESAEVAGPGFVNLRLADPFFLEALGEMSAEYGGGWAESAQRIQVEM